MQSFLLQKSAYNLSKKCGKAVRIKIYKPAICGAGMVSFWYLDQSKK